ncbi:MAG: flagellar export chaperone FlgN [Limisphaerales bacterium]
MTEPLNNFIESLREELKQFGELLALLDLQRDQVVRRLPDELLATVSAINTQGQAIQAARRERAQRQRELAQSLGLPVEGRAGALISQLPQPYRPLVTALIQENNHLLARVRQRARQNHLLLSRAVEMMGRFINSICAIGAPLYTQAGAVAHAAPGCALYDSIG